MILGKSKDPVQLKKIPLKVWALKKEIECTYTHYQQNKPDELEKVKKFYELAYSKDAPKEESEADNESSDTPETEAAEAATEDQSEPEQDASEETENTEKTDQGNVVDISTGLPLKSMTPEEIREYRNQIDRIVPPREYISVAHTFLFDLTIDEVLIFSEKGFGIGQTVVIELDITRGFTIIGEVTYVRNIGMKSRVISENRPNYRIVAKLTLNKPGDRTLLRNFLSSIDPIDHLSDLDLSKNANDNLIIEGEEELSDAASDADNLDAAVEDMIPDLGAEE